MSALPCLCSPNSFCRLKGKCETDSLGAPVCQQLCELLQEWNWICPLEKSGLTWLQKWDVRKTNSLLCPAEHEPDINPPPFGRVGVCVCVFVFEVCLAPHAPGDGNCCLYMHVGEFWSMVIFSFLHPRTITTENSRYPCLLAAKAKFGLKRNKRIL